MPWQSAVSRLVPQRSETLHAQSKPPACVIGEITIKDEDGYKKDFLLAAQKNNADNGGKYIAGGFNRTW
jgi:hypothetical protein